MPESGKPRRVSICLPVFNGERHLNSAIESVVAQTEQDWELIILDDHSIDSSAQIISAWAERDNRIKSERNEQRLGLFENYNKCMSLANGEFIKLLAQDDALHPDCISEMVKAFENNATAALVASGKERIDENDKVIETVVQFPENRSVPGKDVILYNLICITNWIGEPITTMFRRKNMGSGFDLQFYHYGDLDLWFQILRTGDLYYIARPLTKFRKHAHQATTGNQSSLAFMSDLFTLGKKYSDILTLIDETNEHYNERAVEVSAMQIKHLIEHEHLSEETLVQSSSSRVSTAEDNHNLRKALFHNSVMVGRLLHDLHDARETIKFRDKEITELQETVRGITDSKAWKLTATLRKLVQ